MVVAAESPELYPGDIKSVLLGEEQIQTRIAELGAQIGADYRELAVGEDQDLLLITVLKGAVMFVTDLARAIPLPTQFEFMAVSSYGSSTSSSGVVRILKDLDRDINDRDVLIVEDVVDSGLTLSWLLRNLATRHPHSLRVCTLLRKPDALRANVDIAYVGFDIPNEFVVGYGLDYDERYRDLPYIGTLDPGSTGLVAIARPAEPDAAGRHHHSSSPYRSSQTAVTEKLTVCWPGSSGTLDGMAPAWRRRSAWRTRPMPPRSR